MKHDLQQIQNNYFSAGVANTDVGNDLISRLQNHTFSSTGLYLIFIATLFFFLEPKLNYKILFFSINVWLSAAIIVASLSLVVGLVALKITHSHIAKARKDFLGKAQKISRYMNEKKTVTVNEIPEELKGFINDEDMQGGASNLANLFVISQIALFGLSALLVIIVVIRSMF